MLRFATVAQFWWRPILNCAVNRYRNFIGNHMILFAVWHKRVHTFFCKFFFSHYGMTFAYFWFCLLRNKPIEDSTEALVHTASDWSWECVKGDQELFKYPPAFYLPLVFFLIQSTLYWIIDCDFMIDPCALLPTGYRKRAKTIRFGPCSDPKKWSLNS